jgi:hypothetical protein
VGVCEGTFEGFSDGAVDGDSDGASEWVSVGRLEGVWEGTLDRVLEGAVEGASGGTFEGWWGGAFEGLGDDSFMDTRMSTGAAIGTEMPAGEFSDLATGDDVVGAFPMTKSQSYSLSSYSSLESLKLILHGSNSWRLSVA